MNYQFQLPLPPRLVGDLLHRREEIFEDAASAEMDLSVDLHAGGEAKTKRDSRCCSLLKCP